MRHRATIGPQVERGAEKVRTTNPRRSGSGTGEQSARCSSARSRTGTGTCQRSTTSPRRFGAKRRRQADIPDRGADRLSGHRGSCAGKPRPKRRRLSTPQRVRARGRSGTPEQPTHGVADRGACLIHHRVDDVLAERVCACLHGDGAGNGHDLVPG